jgi:hypothetical protein
MRLIVTKLGDEVIKKLSEEDQLKKSQEEELHRLKKLHDLKLKASANEEKMDISERMRTIKIHQSKLNIPKQIIERYNNEPKTPSILPQLVIAKKGSLDNINYDDPALSWTTRLNFQMRDVLPASSLNNLKEKLIKEQRVKELNGRVDHSNFRSSYVMKTELEKLEERLSKEISPDKVNLIKYLNQKDFVSEKFLNKIANYNEDKTYKLNKICQIANHNQIDEQLFQDTIKKALQVQKNKEKIEYKKNIENLSRSVKTINEVIKRYPKPEYSRERYRDLHEEVVIQWKKYHADSLQRKKAKLQSSVTDVTAVLANSRLINTSELY